MRARGDAAAPAITAVPEVLPEMLLDAGAG